MGSGNRSNHSYLVFSSLGAPDSLLDLRCHTDLTSCCNSGDGADRGDWYYPNGTRLSFRDNALFFLRRSQRVSLGRNQELTVDAAAEGIYRCSIETNAVRSDDSSDTTVGEVIYVGIYTGDDGGAPRIQEEFGFEEFRDPDGAISHFVITCISVGGPATRVFWQKNSESFTEGQEDTVLEDTITAQYTHTLTVTGRNEGDYSCIVSNDMPFTNVRTLTVAAPDPPVDLSVSQNGMNSVLVSWTPATTGSISPTGYTITLHPLQDSPGEPVTATAGPTDTSTTVFDLIERAIYSVSIVANSNTLSSNITGPENVTIETVEVSASTIPSAPAMIGDTVTLSCTADLPDGVVGTPSFQWEGQGVNSQGSTLIVSPIELSHAGRYTCTVTISFFNISDSTDIIIQVEAPVPTVQGSRNAPLYIGTSYTLSCAHQLDSLAVSTTTVEWTFDDSTADTSPNHISPINGSLVFSPLDTADAGSYVCRLALTPRLYVVIPNPQQESQPTEITVEDFPLPEVTITTSDSQPGIGGQVELQCSASVVPHLVPQPMLQLVHSGLQSTNTLINSTGLSLSHSVAVDTTSIAGRYLCKVAITEPEINLSVTVVGETQLTLQLPQPSVVINSDQTGTVYAGSSLTLSCVVSLDLTIVDTPTNAIITWDTPTIEKTESHTISNTTWYVSSNISVGPLADGRDNGDYHCTVSLTTDYEYLLGTERVESIALDITSPPPLAVSIATSGLLLTRQSYEFVCTANVVEALLASLDLQLVAPNGTQLILSSGSNTLQYNLSSLATSDSGVYVCRASLTIPGSGIDSSATDNKHITVVDAYPVQDVTIAFSNSSGLELTWRPPQQGHDLTTSFSLACTPLLAGIPPPLPASTGSGAELSLYLTGLYPGVEYNCSVVTVIGEGRSESVSIIQATEEIVPSGPPLSLEVVVGVNDVTFTWSLPEVTLRNGIITGFTLSCFSGGSLMARRTLTEPGSHTVTGLSADTEYNCSVVATNSMGSGPPATLALRTQSAPTEDSSSGGFDLIPVVAGGVAVVLIVSVLVIVVVCAVVVARKRRHKYNLNRARPNSYIMRTADSCSATVTANPSATEDDYSIIKTSGGANAPPPEYEMIRTYSQLPPGKRPAPGYLQGSVEIMTNKHVATTEIDGVSPMKGGVVLNPQYQMLPLEINGAAAVTDPAQYNPQYERIEEYSRVGGTSENVYEVPKGMEAVLPVVGGSQYSVPQSRHSTVSQLHLARHREEGLASYSVPRGRYNTVTQGVSSPSQSLYNTPRSRQHNAATDQPPPPPSLPIHKDPTGKPVANTYDRLPAAEGTNKLTDSTTRAGPAQGQLEGENKGATVYSDVSH